MQSFSESFFEFTRVVWVFGSAVKDGIQDITPTRLTSVVLSKLREADHIAQKILRDSGYHRAISQVIAAAAVAGLWLWVSLNVTSL